MDDLLNNLHELTFELLEKLDETIDEDFEQFIFSRQQLIKALYDRAEEKQDYDREVLNRRIEDILQWDPVILTRMHKLRDEASYEINKLKSSQKLRRGYEPEYSPDSVFFDRHK